MGKWTKKKDGIPVLGIPIFFFFLRGNLFAPYVFQTFRPCRTFFGLLALLPVLKGVVDVVVVSDVVVVVVVLAVVVVVVVFEVVLLLDEPEPPSRTIFSIVTSSPCGQNTIALIVEPTFEGIS